MDRRRLCAGRPYRAQANLTRSWCNEAVLCRTSSWRRAFKSCGCCCGRPPVTDERQIPVSSKKKKKKNYKQKKTEREFQRQSVLFFFLFLSLPLPSLSKLNPHSEVVTYVSECLWMWGGKSAAKSSHRWSAPPANTDGNLRASAGTARLSFFAGTRC